MERIEGWNCSRAVDQGLLQSYINDMVIHMDDSYMILEITWITRSGI